MNDVARKQKRMETGLHSSNWFMVDTQKVKGSSNRAVNFLIYVLKSNIYYTVKYQQVAHQITKTPWSLLKTKFYILNYLIYYQK